MGEDGLGVYQSMLIGWGFFSRAIREVDMPLKARERRRSEGMRWRWMLVLEESLSLHARQHFLLLRWLRESRRTLVIVDGTPTAP